MRYRRKELNDIKKYTCEPCLKLQTVTAQHSKKIERTAENAQLRMSRFTLVIDNKSTALTSEE